MSVTESALRRSRFYISQGDGFFSNRRLRQIPLENRLIRDERPSNFRNTRYAERASFRVRAGSLLQQIAAREHNRRVELEVDVRLLGEAVALVLGHQVPH